MGSLLEAIDDHVVVFMSLPAIVLFLIAVGCVWYARLNNRWINYATVGDIFDHPHVLDKVPSLRRELEV